MVRRLVPWVVVVLIGALLIGVMPSAQAQSGSSAADAIPIGADGRFAGTTPASQSLWYKFNYIGGGQQVTTTLSFEPSDSTRLDLFYFTGDPNNPSQNGATSSLNANTRTISYSDSGGPRNVFIKVENDHPDRSVSFVGTLSPTSTIATPTPTSASNPATPQATPTAGPVAGNAASAIWIQSNNGEFSGTIASGQAVWFRAYYGNPGADMTINITLAPSADNADLNVYTGTDVNNLGPTQQGGSQVRNGNTISRHVNFPNAQWVYFSLGNNGANVLAYGGSINPFTPPPATVTPTAGGTGTPTAGPTSTPAPVPTAAPVAHDTQYYAQTGFRVDDQMVSYFNSRGGVDTFGFPISRVFTFLGCPVQMYQRLIIQTCPGQQTALINLLDPEIFPYTRVNGSVFPSPDDQLKQQTPAVGSPNYSTTIMPFIQSVTPDTFMGQPVNFWQTYMKDGALEVLGAPISHPQPDPSNSNFIYQRFQRVILHYRAGIGTEPLLLADYQKQIMLGPNAPNLPSDLQQQASGSKFYSQYCKGGTRWLCRPNDLPTTDLTNAFEQS
ncbi:MAG: hypothetical protein JO352_23470 [Chloroflexi bacterium]|nr:hypothetical protein [Chloroflexota bacterium]MBV9599379.1 hypothetical protein [Chloroflexota bacterium]